MFNSFTEYMNVKAFSAKGIAKGKGEKNQWEVQTCATQSVIYRPVLAHKL